MSYLFTQIFPALKTVEILGKADLFESWLESKYGIKDNNQIFDGYLFSINCCLNSFLDGIANDYSLKIKNDLLLERAMFDLTPIHKIENTCEKTIFLKNLKPFIKRIRQSKNFSGLKNQINVFNDNVSSRFVALFNEHVSVKQKCNIKKDEALQLTLINFAHTYLIQINNSGPTANFFNPLSVEHLAKERKNYFLKGYKYAILFLWYHLLGETRFEKTTLVDLHTADSWREYKCSAMESKNDLDFLFNRHFDLEEQRSLDSYFYRIKNEITDQLEQDYKLPIHRIDSIFRFSFKAYKKERFFSDFLMREMIDDPFVKLSWEDKIRNRLYYYPFEIINADRSQMHFGVPSFNTMLAGTVSLHDKKESEFSKVIVIKFIHPHGKETSKNDYSYGILIDTKSAAGHYHSGWVIYQNACGDYSGFSGSEYRATEGLIKKYKKENKIELRQLIIPLGIFQKFIDKSVLRHEQLSILQQNKLIPKIIQASRSHCFELFTYYVHNRFYGDKYRISLNTDKKSKIGEKDVVLENDDEVIIIECKLNPQNQNFPEAIAKLEAKLAEFSQKIKSFQFWFWEDFSLKSKEILDKSEIRAISVSNPRGEPVLKNVDLSALKFIMQDYEGFSTYHSTTEYQDIST